MNKDRILDNLYKIIDNFLEKFNYEYKLIEQFYDGASVNPEYLNGL